MSLVCIWSIWSISCYSHKMANGKVRKAMGREEFRLAHYAGEVNYNVNGEKRMSVCKCLLMSILVLNAIL